MGCACAGEREKLASTSAERLQDEPENSNLRKPAVTPKTPATNSRRKAKTKSAAHVRSDSAPVLDFNISLRSADDVRLLNKPLSTYYSLSTAIHHDPSLRLTKAENTATKQPCIILHKPDKSIYDSHKAEEHRYSWKLWSSLDHPLILKAYECLRDAKSEYWVFEDYDGGNAEEWLLRDRGRLQEKLVMKVMFQVFTALSYIHSKGVAVRNLDLKSIVFPQTTNESLEVKLGHFYYACEYAAVRQLPHSTRKSQFLSPEARTGYNGPECDLWSCGVLLHYLLSNSPPFPESEDPAELEAAMCSKVELRSPRWMQTTEGARMLVLRLLSPRTEDRPSIAECLSSPCVRIHAKKCSLSSYSVRKTLACISSSNSRVPVRQAIIDLILTRVVKKDSLNILSDTFKALDTDFDGSISREELLIGMRKIHPEAEAVRITEEVMKSADRNNSGNIDYTEFLLISQCEEKLMCKENLKKAFSSFDSDKNGKISLVELKEALVLKQGETGETVWQAIVQGLDTSGDGEIGYPEFQAMIEGALG